jgi:hypothetical protein
VFCGPDVANFFDFNSGRKIINKFVLQEGGGDEARVQKIVIGGWEGPVIQPQPQVGNFQVLKAAAGEKETRPVSGQAESIPGRDAEVGRRFRSTVMPLHQGRCNAPRACGACSERAMN